MDDEPVRGMSLTSNELHQRRDGSSIPKLAICQAVGLLLFGSVLLGVGLDQWLTNPKGHWVILAVLGSLTFLPGFYFSRIAFLAWRGYDGFSFSQLPNVA